MAVAWSLGAEAIIVGGARMRRQRPKSAYAAWSMPTGVFLFSDIEGSTRRWLADPEAMSAALAAHDETLLGLHAVGGRRRRQAHRGRPRRPLRFGGGGGGRRGRRTTPPGQARGRRDLPGSLRVRMAVHAGDAEPRGDDWFGPALNRCTRSLSVGHGGQVLVSDAARALCADRLPLGLGFVDFGLHRLRDLVDLEHVWQLARTGCRRLSAAAQCRRLPWEPATPAHELRRARRGDRLARRGGGGASPRHDLRTGREREEAPALELGEAVAHGFPGGVWLVELAALERGDGGVDAVLAALGANVVVDVLRRAGPRRPGRPPRTVLLDNANTYSRASSTWSRTCCERRRRCGSW